MADTIHLLDFRRGTVEEIDNSAPPHGLKGPAPMGPADEAGRSTGEGYVLTALGSPPRPDDEDEDA